MSPTFQYLIMLNSFSDDIPLLITNCQDSAFEFAKNTGWEYMGTQLEGILDLPAGGNSPICISIVTFRDGKPCSRVVVRSFDDEDDDDDDDEQPPVVDPTPEQMVG